MSEVVAATVRPIPGSVPTVMPTTYDLGALGYVEEEYVLEGMASSYRLVGARSSDGRWDAEPAAASSFRTRLLVRRPVDAARFSGTALVEWLNVSGGVDAGPDWTYLHRHLMRRGDAWVGVSAQKAGIDGGGLVPGFPLKVAAPDRYGELDHPGDSFSYDIFTQAGRVVRAGGPSSPLGGLQPEHVLAVGESQSAMHLTSYINAVDPLVAMFDGFLVHGRGAAGAPFDVEGALSRAHIEGAMDVGSTIGEAIRDDARVPVVILQSETDVVLLGSVRGRQPDGDRVRLWEIAGAAHADTYLLIAGHADGGDLPPDRFATMLRPVTELFGMPCGSPINCGPQQHYVAHAAYQRLLDWVVEGTPPPRAAPLELAGDGTDYVRDDDGIARGGVRTPWVDVPACSLSGLGQSGEMFSMLFGTTTAFAPGALSARYGGRDGYLAGFTEQLDAAIAAGFLLADDRDEIIAVAGASYDDFANS